MLEENLLSDVFPILPSQRFLIRSASLLYLSTAWSGSETLDL